MTNEQATALLTRITSETPLLDATLVLAHAKSHKSVVQVYHPGLRRRLTIRKVQNWEDVKQAWGLTV